jgi:DNA-binding NarL/FixJ family response regulator
MPRMNGLDAACELKRLMPPVPMILYTMHTQATSEIMALDAGFSAVVSKTDRLDALVDKVQSLLEPVG